MASPADMIADDDGEEDLMPLYSYYRGEETEQYNLACSSSKGFCFFCQYVSGDEASESAELRAHVRTLIAEEKEPATIASSVKRIYDQQIKHLVTGTVRGEEVSGPEWSEASITRHILTSGEFPNIFNAVQRRLYQSIILRQQRHIVKANGSVDCKKTRALLHTMREFNCFNSHMVKEPPAKRQKK